MEETKSLKINSGSDILRTMKQTKRLISQLELQYGNNHMGLASQVGYLTGVLKSMESEVEGISKFIEEHTDYLIQSKRAQALIRGGVPAEQVIAGSFDRSEQSKTKTFRSQVFDC